MVPEDELDACPWASGIDISADHVILAISARTSPEVHWPDCVACGSARIGMFRPSGRQGLPAPAPEGEACRLGPEAQLVLAGTWARAKRCGRQQRRKGGSRKWSGAVGTHTVKMLLEA
jgi:hypothetical protein